MKFYLKVICNHVAKILLRITSKWRIYFHSCTVHLDTIESFIYPTDAQIDCSKNVKIYMRGAATCFGFSQLYPAS